MGADLYLQSIIDKNYERYGTKLKALEDRRDKATTDEARRRAQAQVNALIDEIYAPGYFRDSYSASSLLGLFGLSWWKDVMPLRSKDRYLTPRHVAGVRQRFVIQTAI